MICTEYTNTITGEQSATIATNTGSSVICTEWDTGVLDVHLDGTDNRVLLDNYSLGLELPVSIADSISVSSLPEIQLDDAYYPIPVIDQGTQPVEVYLDSGAVLNTELVGEVTIKQDSIDNWILEMGKMNEKMTIFSLIVTITVLLLLFAMAAGALWADRLLNPYRSLKKTPHDL